MFPPRLLRSLGFVLFCSSTTLLSAQSPPLQWVVRPQENTAAIKNPGKGWRGQIGNHFVWGDPPVDDLGSQPIGTPLESLRKWYVAWNEFEDHESDDPSRLKKLTDEVLADFPSQGLQAIPRLAISSKRGSEAPQDLPGLDDFFVCDWYEDPKVQKRIERMIARAGKAWDNDPRIAFVEMGVVGKYGEHWGLDKYPKVQEYLHRAFEKAFRHKHILIRDGGRSPFDVPRQLAEAADYGFYQDSFTVPVYENRTRKMAALDGGTRWQRAPIGGETAVLKHTSKRWRYYLSETANGSNKHTVPNALTDKNRYEELKDWIREFHTSFLGSPNGVQLVGQPNEPIEEIHKMLGYRFVIDEVRGPSRLEAGGEFELTLKVRNLGSGVLFGDYRLEVAFLSKPNAKPSAKVRLDTVNPQTWLPGTDYDIDANVYRNPAGVFTIQESIRVPDSLKPGNYTLCLAIMGPDGTPPVRFAIDRYWSGGFHPIAAVGVNEKPNQKIDPTTFFLDGVDPLIHGTIKPNGRGKKRLNEE